jgi:hypothetical protein
VVGFVAEGAVVDVHRWLVGPIPPLPAASTPVVVQGRASGDPDIWSSVDWEPQVGQAWVVTGTPDGANVIQTSLCGTVPLTPEVMATIAAIFGPSPSASPLAEWAPPAAAASPAPIDSQDPGASPS